MIPWEQHNHQQCITSALGAAKDACRQRGERLTRTREKVLRLLWQSHQPQGAYAILEQLSAEEGRSPAPPTVYRALEFLEQCGLAHRVSSLNAWIGCNHPQASHSAQLLICQECGRTAELHLPSAESALREEAGQAGFQVDHCVIEVHGLCPRCSGEKDRD